MAEKYVQDIMDAVSRLVPPKQEVYFWEWLAREKYPQADGMLMPEIANSIHRNLHSLYLEFKER